MPHKPQSEILSLIKKAQQTIPVGAKYAHYKDKTKTYTIVGFAVIEADDSIGVLYQAQYGENLTFVRPVDVWLEQVQWQGKRVPRFSKVS